MSEENQQQDDIRLSDAVIEYEAFRRELADLPPEAAQPGNLPLRLLEKAIARCNDEHADPFVGGLVLHLVLWHWPAEEPISLDVLEQCVQWYWGELETERLLRERNYRSDIKEFSNRLERILKIRMARHRAAGRLQHGGRCH